MKKVKKFLLAATALATILPAVGCSKDETASKKSEDVTLRMSWWGNDDRHKKTLEAIEAFEEKNPGIKVKAEYSGWDGTVEKMTTQIAGGTEPDLMQMNYDWYTSFSPTGDGLYNLNDLKDIISLDDYDKKLLESGTIDGKLNGIPFGENTFVIALNKTTFDKFGAEIPSTWDGYIEAAKKFDEGYYPIARGGFNLVVTYLTQQTGKGFLSENGKVNYSKKQLQEGLEWYQNLVDNKVIPTRKTQMETIGNAHPSTVKEFISGKLAGVTDWTGGLASYDSVLATSGQALVIPSYPIIENAKNAGVIKKPSMLFSISKNSKHPKEAAKLLNFLLNDPEGIKLMGTSRGVPANAKAVKLLQEDGQLSGIAAEANKFAETTDGVTESPYFEMAAVIEVYDSILERFELGELDAKEAASQIYNQVNATVSDLAKK